MCCSLVEITFHAHYSPQRDILSPHSVQQEIEFQRDSVNRPGHTAQGNGIRITRKPTIAVLMSTFKKKNLTFTSRKFFQIANINVSGRSKEEEIRVWRKGLHGPQVAVKVQRAMQLVSL